MKDWIRRRHLILLAVGLALLYWALEGLVMLLFFEEGAYAEQFFYPDPHELWMHSLTTVLILVFGAYAQIMSDRRRRMVEEVRESEMRYRVLFELSMDAMFLVDGTTGYYLDANPAAERLTGRSAAELKTMTRDDLIPEDADDAIKQVGGEAVPTDRGEISYSGLDWQKRWGLLTTIPLDENRTYAIIRDITERKQAEESLRESEEKYRSLFDSMLDGFAHHEMVLNDEGQPVDYVFRSVNAAFERLTGLRREDVVGRSVREVLPGIEDDPADWIGTYGKVALHGEEVHFEQFSEQLQQWYSVSAYCPQKGQFVTLFHNITGRRRAEAELKESREWLSTTLLSIGDAVIATDDRGHVTLLNPVAQTMTGWNEQDAVGKPLQEIFNIVNEETGEQAESPVAKVMREGVVVGLANHTLLVARDGTIRPVDDSGAPIRDDSGNIKGVVLVFRDITERKHMEERAQQSQILASLGEMTAGIAHEVNNPLAAILLYSELVAQADAPAAVQKDIRVIRNEARRASKIMKDLLTYSRKAAPIMRQLDIHKTIKKVVDMRRYQESVRNIDTDVRLADGPLRSRGSASQLTQVFMNLIVNAEESVEKSDDKRIVVTTETLGEVVRISIADSGGGIRQENLGRVFTPFFSTKPVGKGTGLGLATCHGIVTAHGGQIRAENNDMGGATFIVELPLAK